MSMTIGFMVVDEATGAILRRGTCQDTDLDAQGGDGEIVLQVDPAVPVDPLSQRFDAETDAVVDWVPDAPVDDEWATWSWDTEIKRWVAAPTLAALKRDAILPVQMQIEAVERAQVRPTSAIVLALLDSSSPDSGDVTQLSTLEVTKTDLRDLRSAMESAATAEELEDLIPD